MKKNLGVRVDHRLNPGVQCHPAASKACMILPGITKKGHNLTALQRISVASSTI